MNRNSNLYNHFRCGEIFQTTNHEFLIFCLICNKEFPSFLSFTEHIVDKDCATPIKTKVNQSIENNSSEICPVSIKKEIINLNSSDEECLNYHPSLVNEVNNKQDKLPAETVTNYQNKDTQIQKIPTIDLSKKSITTISNKTRKIGSTKHNTNEKTKKIIKKKIIWDPDDPETQMLFDNFQNLSKTNNPIKPINKKLANDIVKSLQKFPLKNIAKIEDQSIVTVTKHQVNKNIVKQYKSFQQNAIKPLTPVTPAKPRRVKKVIWDPDAPGAGAVYF